ncbi:MAG: DUF4384 domain-containing protein [Deltaproteobacteria bacterium]|nr:DUF4384 domain-containing protein [Deltaproteobacteria bacterium]
MKRRLKSRTSTFTRGLLGIVALALAGCVGAPIGEARPKVHTDHWNKAASSRAPAAPVDKRMPSLLDAPRVRRMARRGWVEVEAAVLASDDESPAAARRRALKRARQAAVEFVAGVAVRSSVLLIDHESRTSSSSLLQALTATQSEALVIDEKLIDSDVQISRGEGYRARVLLQARVLEHKNGSRASFETEVRLNQNAFRAGDRVDLAVRASTDARIYVLNVNDEGAIVLLPNRHVPDTFVEADQWLEFPGRDLAAQGVALHAALPEGRRESQEVLLVVALRGKRRLRDLLPASSDGFRSAKSGQEMDLLNEFLSPLLSIPVRDWTFDQIVYRISED